MTFMSTKTFEHAFSCAFRQHRAHSHCRLIHGYAFDVTFVFGAEELDSTNWVVDFGSLKSLKGMLENTFDHKLVVAEDDPHLGKLLELDALGVADVVVLAATGCERFAEAIAGATDTWLQSNGYSPRVHLVSVTVAEHTGNSAIFMPKVEA